MTSIYNQLSLLESFGGQDQDDTVDGVAPNMHQRRTPEQVLMDESDRPLIPLGYDQIQHFHGPGWMYCTDGISRSPFYYHPAPLSIIDTFKVGDRVKTIGTAAKHCPGAGQILEIYKIGSHEVYSVLLDGKDRRLAVFRADLERIEEGDRPSFHVEAPSENPETPETSLSAPRLEEGDRPQFEYGDRIRAIAVKSGKVVEGIIVSLGHSYAKLDDLYDGPAVRLDTAELLSPGLAHQKNDPELFGGQDQESNNQQIAPIPTASKFGEYWIEENYKTIKGKTYGPYLVQRWRDENGKKRSRYLGKAPKGSAAPGQPA